jgi:hypothetical protein
VMRLFDEYAAPRRRFAKGDQLDCSELAVGQAAVSRLTEHWLKARSWHQLIRPLSNRKPAP